MRSKKAIINMVVAIVAELVKLVCGLILPRVILRAFGSSYNGITSSITQFLSGVALLRAGVCGMTRAALYKPLAEGDTHEISAIINATEAFMRKVSMIFAAALFAFACLYPLLVSYEFEWLFSFTLVLILGISTFVQYYFGITYQTLLESDQRDYVIAGAEIVTIIINTLLAVVLIRLGAGIHLVKLGSASAFALSPLLLFFYARKHYHIDKTVAPNNSAIAQRWDAFWQTVSVFVYCNTDVMVLTVFADIKEVSVYTVYNYVVANIRNIIMKFVIGFGSAFGNMLARKEYDLMRENMLIYELIVFNLTAIVYTTAGIMIVPFVMVYTKGVFDVNYARPLYALIAMVAGSFFCFRLPYQSVIEAAGHFRQTKKGAITEACLNLGISVLAVIRFGLVGVAAGTLIATVYRTVQYAAYLSDSILPRSKWLFWKHVLVNLLIALICLPLSESLIRIETPNFPLWTLKAFLVVILTTAWTLVFDLIFYRRELKALFVKIRHALRSRFRPEGI